MVWRAPNEDAADGGAEPHSTSPQRAGGEDRELVSAMPLGDPHRLVSERFSPLRAIGDLGGGQPARERDSDSRLHSGPLRATVAARTPRVVQNPALDRKTFGFRYTARITQPSSVWVS